MIDIQLLIFYRNLKKKVKFAQLMIIENKTQQLRLAQMHESLDQQQA